LFIRKNINQAKLAQIKHCAAKKTCAILGFPPLIAYLCAAFDEGFILIEFGKLVEFGNYLQLIDCQFISLLNWLSAIHQKISFIKFECSPVVCANGADSPALWPKTVPETQPANFLTS
jgi:hypothetical protein